MYTSNGPRKLRAETVLNFIVDATDCTCQEPCIHCRPSPVSCLDYLLSFSTSVHGLCNISSLFPISHISNCELPVMPSARKGAWRFDTLWRLPSDILGSTSFTGTDQSSGLNELESAFKRDVVERTTFPIHTRNVEIKYKLSDLELALHNPPHQLPITGYIQSERQKKIDSGNLLRWLQARWSPVDNQLVRNNTYREWSRMDPAYRHAQVHGEPAVATRGPGRKQVCVRHRI